MTSYMLVADGSWERPVNSGERMRSQTALDFERIIKSATSQTEIL